MKVKIPLDRAYCRNFFRSKKGAFARLWQAAVGLGIFILVTALVALMVDEVRDIALENPRSATATNASISLAVNNTPYTYPGSQTAVTGITALYNDSANAITIPTVLYTWNVTHVIFYANGTHPVGTRYITYSFNYPSSAENVTDEGLEAIGLMADWQSIVVIAVIMIVIIGLILREFGYLG